MKKILISESDYIHVVESQRSDFFASLGVKGRNGNYSITYEDRNFSCMPFWGKAIDSKIQGLSFFSGAGGLDIGAQMAGIKVISSLDFEKDAVETMRANPFFVRSAISY